MASKPDWLSVDVKAISHDQLAEFISQLEDSDHQELRLELQREFIDRLRAHGLSDAKIIDNLVFGVPKGAKRDRVSKGWARALGLTIMQFNRIASGN